LTAACCKVKGFNELIEKLRRNISIQEKSESTFKNYATHLASMALHYDCLPTDLDEDQINDFLYLMQTRLLVTTPTKAKASSVH
jgi:hypothetical protein